MPLGYQVNDSTWFYLSLLLIVAVFFRFHRFWSLRNLDLCLLLASGPGLLLVREEEYRVFGFTWLFTVTALFLVRLLADSLLQKRPPLAQNLNAQGMGFLCASAFVLLTMQAVSHPLPPESTQQTVQRAGDLVTLTDRGETAAGEKVNVVAGPTATLLAAPGVLVFEHLAPKVMAMMAHLAVIIGLLFVGRNLFGDQQLGLAMGTLYLLLPCTAYAVGEFNHVLPAALIVWAIVAYRKPVVAGVLMGLACGALFFPLFLVPLWIMFYGRRGGMRFAAALSIMAAVLLGSYALTSASPDSFWQKTMGTIRLPVLAFEAGEGAINFWKEGEYDSPYRIPVIAAYFVMLAVLTLWSRKNLEHLIAHSAALIVGTQFWYPQQGGVYLSWYMPLLMIVVFRPRLTHLSPPLTSETIVEVKKDPVRPSRLTPTSRVHLFR